MGNPFARLDAHSGAEAPGAGLSQGFRISWFWVSSERLHLAVRKHVPSVTTDVGYVTPTNTSYAPHADVNSAKR